MKAPSPRILLAFAALTAHVSVATAQQSAVRTAFGLSPDKPNTSSLDFAAREAAYVPEGLSAEQQFADESLQTASATDGCPIGYGGCDQTGTCESGHENVCYCGDNFACDGCCGGCGSCVEDCGDGCGDGCACGCDGCCGDCISGDLAGGIYYAEVQNIFMRAHVSSDVVGKLHEKYEWSPRVVLGYESSSAIGGRLRWWSYARTTATLDDTDSLRFELDVVDVEGTTRFVSKRADLLLSGGFRWADFDVVEDGDDEVEAEMPGITFAADGRIAICRLGCSQWSSVCGARWSILGGDWEGDDNDIIAPTLDDNVTTQEIYGGFEYLRRQSSYDLYARIVFEVQNWHSDALGETSAADSIGFVGPAIHAGVEF